MALYANTAMLLLMQNALKVFSDFPPALMEVVRNTDPSTVTQHGLYTRDLSQCHVHNKSPGHGQGNAEAHAHYDKENSTHDAVQLHPRQQNHPQSQSKGSDRLPNRQASPGSRGVWGRGRVTLVGDAAHATVNNGQCCRILRCCCFSSCIMHVTFEVQGD